MPRDPETFHGDTLQAGRRKPQFGLAIPTLTIACHPQASRVGERLRMPDLELGDAVEISRLSPIFEDARRKATQALKDPFLSRAPLTITPVGQTLRLEVNGRFKLRVDGAIVSESIAIHRDRLVSGVTIELGGRVLLVLHGLGPRFKRAPSYGMTGASQALAELRNEIRQAAGAPVQVLLQGESGTGKELVARAIHDASPRASMPFVGVNIAAIPATTAASELFGHVRGAFTGADRDRKGLFQRADGGTLFLDEIGETPSDLQPLLLRALETGEVQPVGSDSVRKVDVRIVAATDADLERAVSNGGFRLALLHRLQGFQIETPPLRHRRDDIGLLLVHFLTESLGEDADEILSTDLGEEAWLGSDVVEPLLRYHWPGNVRQLRNAARQIAVSYADQEVASLGKALSRLLPTDGVASSGATAVTVVESRAGARSDLGGIDDATLAEVMRANQWRVGPSAKALGVAKNSLYRLIERNPLIRKANTLTEAEIAAARAEVGDSATRIAEHLEVSRHGFQLRLRVLGLDLKS